MRIRVNNYHEFLWDESDNLPDALPDDIPLVIVIDPGKTNMAMYIGTPAGNVLRSYEFSGKGQDTSVYCAEFKRYINALLGGCKVVFFGQEAAISKEGFQYHKSMLVLTEIRAILVELCKDQGWGKSEEMNNWSWKSSVLPKEYRSRSEKGSHRYLSTLDYAFADATHDLTDVCCMFIHACKKWKGASSIYCDAVERALTDIPLAIIDRRILSGPLNTFKYNRDFSLTENAIYFANRRAGAGWCELHPDRIQLTDLFKYGKGLTYMSDPVLFIPDRPTGGLYPKGRWI